MSPTDCPTKEDAVSTSDASQQKEPVPRSRHGWRLVLIAVVAISVIAALTYKLVQTVESGKADGEARDAAVALYAQQLDSTTDGAIAIDVRTDRKDFTNTYLWSGDDHTLTVTVQLGGCTVDAKFHDVPNRPKNVSDLGDLMFTLNSERGGSYLSIVSATAPDLYDKVTASSLAHCVAGDRRLMRPNYSG